MQVLFTILPMESGFAPFDLPRRIFSAFTFAPGRHNMKRMATHRLEVDFFLVTRADCIDWPVVRPVGILRNSRSTHWRRR